MCGLVGIYCQNVTPGLMQTFERVILESRIRGLHATGITYLKAGKLTTLKASLPATRFLSTFSLNKFVDNNALYLVAHCRYSTSDLEFNQPFSNQELALVHNGVITQELPENWAKLYGFTCKTRNDTELLLKTVEASRSPFKDWPHSSIAAIELYNTGVMRAYRNGQRPLYMSFYQESYIFTSTADIAFRSGLMHPINVPPWQYVILHDNEYQLVTDSVNDLQSGADLQPWK